MRILAAASEAEMVKTFLRAELASEQFSASLRVALQAEGVEPAAVEAVGYRYPELSARLRGART